MSAPWWAHDSAGTSPETCRDLLSGSPDGYLTRVSNTLGMIIGDRSAVVTMRVPFVVIGGLLLRFVLRFWKLL